MLSLRRIVFDRTGYNLGKCQSCLFCDKETIDRMDVTLSALVQMVLFNDDEVLTTHTLWSDEVLEMAAHSCCNGFDLSRVILALRQEAQARGMVPGG